jgi:hypothetical protein
MDKEYSYSNLGDGLQLVASAGTAEALAAAATPCRLIVVSARPENTDVVVVGASTVVAAAGTRRGISLVPGQSVSLHVKDVSSLFVDAVVSGEGVSYVYFY